MVNRMLICITLSLLACLVIAQQSTTSFLAYQLPKPDDLVNPAYFSQQSAVVFKDYNCYGFDVQTGTVYVTNLVPLLNISFDNPPASDTFGPITTAYSLANKNAGQESLARESIASAVYYTSQVNTTNSGWYISGTSSIYQFDGQWNTIRYAPIIRDLNSVALISMFIDGQKLYAPSTPGSALFIYDLEKFDRNSTQNYTLATTAAATSALYDPSTHTGFFFGRDGTVDVWDTAKAVSVTQFDTHMGYYGNYTLPDQASAADFGRGLLYLVASSLTNTTGSNQVIVLQVFNITNARSLSGVLVPLEVIILNQSPTAVVNSISLETVGGQAFIGISDFTQGSWLRVDLLRNKVVDTVPVAQDSNNGRTAWNYQIGIQNQSIVVVSDAAYNSYEYPTTCPNDCTGPEYGFCNYGTCICTPLYTSDDCSQLACPFSCGESQGRGACNNGQCACQPMWTGAQCDQIQCPNACTGNNGVCNGPTSNYTCTCNFRYTGDDCSQPKVLQCNEIPGAQECTGRTDCGWCQSESKCMPGNNIGPVAYACPDWFYENPKDIGIMAFAIIYIIICAILLIINFISALVIDHQNATELIATKRLTATTIRRNWWRDERSNMAWLLFEQLQFISLFGLVTVGYSTRILSFTRYFDWTCLVIPLPGYMDKEIHQERSTARVTLDYEQYGNGNDSGIEQIWYAQMVWLAIFFGVATICNLVYSLIATLVRGSASKDVFFSRLVHMWMRMLNVFYFPLIVIAASHTYYGGSSIAGSIIVLIVIGLGLPAASLGLTFGRSKQLFRYEWRAKFGAFYSTFHFNRPYFQMVILAKKLAAGLLIGFMAAPLSRPTLAFGQVFGAIGVMIIYIVVIIIMRPFLDKVHLILEVGLNILSIVSIGMALTNYASPSLIGDIIFLLLQIIALLIILGAFIHCWLAMEKVNCCGPKQKDDEANTSELATMKM